ncbi:MAG: hypothetical protein ACREJC_03640 [Tepidisphaeraceae bacterium]
MNQRISLDVIDIATPCPASWDDMHGDDRVRFCDSCRLHVYDLSSMSREAAEELVSSREGRLCVRFYRRTDGAIVTRDCGRIRAAARRTRAVICAVGAAVWTLALVPLGLSRAEPNHDTELLGTMKPPDSPVMGDIAFPPATMPATRPATQPTTQPAIGVPLQGEIFVPQAVMGRMVAPDRAVKGD